MSVGTIIDAIISAIWGARIGHGHVNVEEILAKRQEGRAERLDWRNSIVDLLKLLDMDSSVTARARLARELGYTGSDPDGSAAKNIWLHQKVMQKLEENGGRFK